MVRHGNIILDEWRENVLRLDEDLDALEHDEQHPAGPTEQGSTGGPMTPALQFGHKEGIGEGRPRPEHRVRRTAGREWRCPNHDSWSESFGFGVNGGIALPTQALLSTLTIVAPLC